MNTMIWRNSTGEHGTVGGKRQRDGRNDIFIKYSFLGDSIYGGRGLAGVAVAAQVVCSACVYTYKKNVTYFFGARLLPATDNDAHTHETQADEIKLSCTHKFLTWPCLVRL